MTNPYTTTTPSGNACYVTFSVDGVDYVHVVPLEGGAGGEYSACGYADDAHATEGNGLSEWQAAACRIVTCPECKAVVLSYQGVRVSSEP